MSEGISSFLDKKPGLFFVLEKESGETIAIPLLHLVFFSFHGDYINLQFTSHSIKLHGFNTKVLFDKMLSGDGIYLKVLGSRFESQKGPNMLFLTEVEIEEID